VKQNFTGWRTQGDLGYERNLERMAIFDLAKYLPQQIDVFHQEPIPAPFLEIYREEPSRARDM